MPHHKDLRININRLKNDLLTLGNIGLNPETGGVTRQGFTAIDFEGRHWLQKQYEAIGLSSRIDQAGNVICRYGEQDKPAVVMGSHIDTVPNGGFFDGTVGVLSGLECLRTIKENNLQLERPIDVIAFSEEEGRFGGMFGVQAFAGQLTQEKIDTAQDSNGVFLKDALKDIGLNPDTALQAQRDPAKTHAYLELHIEQGPVLERLKKSIGVVTGITGIFDWHVTLKGEANHSGTTPMEMRKDAFAGLCAFGAQYDALIKKYGSDFSRLTIGHVKVLPGYSHVVPGQVEFVLSVRDLDEDVMRRLAKGCEDTLNSIADEKGLGFHYEEKAWLPPRKCTQKIVDVIQNNAENLSYSHHIMPSGACHDTQIMSTITDAAMIFVPSIAGISHSPKEKTDWPDIEKGANVLLQSCLDLAS